MIDTAGVSHPISPPNVWLDQDDRWQEVRRFSSSRSTDRGTDADVAGEDAYTVYENRRALPRAWFVSELTALDDNDAIQSVRSSQLPDGRRFDPSRMAIVDPAHAPETRTFPAGTASGPANAAPSAASSAALGATVQRIEDGRVTLSVHTEGGGYLVLSDGYYPSWRARIDGATTEVYRTNVALQGIVVPPGRHDVVFELASTTLRAGAVMSITGLVACLLLLSPLRVRGR